MTSKYLTDAERASLERCPIPQHHQEGAPPAHVARLAELTDEQLFAYCEPLLDDMVTNLLEIIR